MKTQQQSRAHHYVPQWYQKRFLPAGITKFHYLDLHPDTVVNNGVAYQRNELLRWGPKRCFYKDDLYTLKFGSQTSDEMERLFFGEIDKLGRAAVEKFADFQGISDGAMVAFGNVAPYMGAQRFRTPRGLDDLKRQAVYSTEQNAVLATLRAVFQAYATMWSEGVWEIVRATQSPTKFIVTDDPVTFYCKVVFPSEWTYPNDVSLRQIGTRTIFPLGLESCLIITHLQLARNPGVIFPTEHRANARYFDRTLKHIGEIQFGRELEEDEVLRINYILKRRATRYIAAANEEWLYPERRVSTTDWKKLDDDWFLLPNLWRVNFTTQIVMGFRKAPPFVMDEYGRKPWDDGFQNRGQRERERQTFEAGKREWARKRVGKSRSRNDEGFGKDITDQMIDRFLAETDEKAATPA